MDKKKNRDKKDYIPNDVEPHWQKIWEEKKVYSPNLDISKKPFDKAQGKPFYNLMMFPYPSAEGMHVGNMYAFTGADVYGRFMRMRGYDVFEPIGLDGFGIHSENYAIKTGRHPKEQAKISETNFYRQLRATGNGFDWSRKLETYDPRYYKWTQWLFIQLFKAGLAYRAKAKVNWCPSCKTVLADEQVVKGQHNVGKTRHDVYGKEDVILVSEARCQTVPGEAHPESPMVQRDSGQARMTPESSVCERCGTEVYKKELEQWFFRITKYADRLLKNIDKLDWTEKVKIAQRQWIGKSEGTKIKFPLDGHYSYLILHAHKGTPQNDFYPWLKKELEKRGARVSIPQLPGGLHPNIEEQVKFLIDNYKFDRDSVFVTHSLGGVAAMKLLPRLKTKISKLVMVAPPLRTEFLDQKPRPEVERATDWKFDFEGVKEKVSDIVVFMDTHDYVIPHSHPREIANQLGGKLIEVKAKTPHFRVKEAPEILAESIPAINVFTTRADTLYGATFLVISPEHPLVAELLKSEVRSQKLEVENIKRYVEKARKKTELERLAEGKDKTGVFSGLYAINPLNNEKIPVWIADYAVMGYGTGALFGDAHDERDFQFAKKYGIPLKPTIITGDKEKDEKIMSLDEVYTGYGTLVDSREFTGLTSQEGKKKITAWLKDNNVGGVEVTYHLRDWLISRQRYWGPPIPMIYCQSCADQGRSWFSEDSENSVNQKIRQSDTSEIQNVPPTESSEFSEMRGWFPDENLPVLLPDVKDWKPLGTGKSPLANHPEFYKVKCPNCKGLAKRETDVSDTFLDSAWYFFRYTSTDIDSVCFDTKRVKKWLPVKMYIGGAEHSVLHLLYSRFITMVLSDLDYIGFEEPFSRFFAHGLLIKEGAKMSKSRGNVVVPDEYIRKFGADALRLYLMFLGPFSQGGDFYDTALEGMYRFVKRVWRLIAETTQNHTQNNAEKNVSVVPRGVQLGSARLQFMHSTIKKVTEDISNLRYNTAIASLMEWHNYLKSKINPSTSLRVKNQKSKITREEVEVFLKLLAPFAPHVTEELWQRLRRSQKDADQDADQRGSAYNDQRQSAEWSIHLQPWPSYDPKFLEEDEVTIVVQVNGKVRDTLKVQSSKFKVQSYVEELATKRERVRKYLEGKEVGKVVYVEGKVINFVTT